MKNCFISILSIVISCAIWNCTSEPKDAPELGEPYKIEHITTGDAIVVSAHPLASKIGVEIMKNGGNAVDAAVAVQFALAVVYPRAGNIGGGGFAVVRDSTGINYSLDFREKAPAKAHREMYLDRTKTVIPNLSTKSHLAVGVPGSVKGLYQLWDSLGKIERFSTLIKPAIQIALNGFPINTREAERINKYMPDFKQFHSESSPFLNNKWKTGDTLVQFDLAQTLQRIAEAEHPKGFYEGVTAEMLVDEMKRGHGLIDHEDLLSYEAVWRQPIKGVYKGFEVVSMPPPSSGGLALLQLLEMIELHDISNMTPDDAEYIHLLVEAERRVYADRAKYLGDPDFVEVPTLQLLDSAYISGRMADFDTIQASKSTSIYSGNINVNLESFETTHTSVVDDSGMAVALTTTLNTNYGSKILVEGAGFFLNNEMDDFSAKPGVPNTYGLVGAEANAIAPEKRMLSSMTPTIVVKDNKPFLVLGTPGGSTIITSVLQVMLNVIEHNMTLENAVAYPRFHHQWLPDQIFIEKEKYSDETLNALRNMGHDFKWYSSLGLVKAIKLESDGTYTGVGDQRSDDHAESLTITVQ